MAWVLSRQYVMVQLLNSELCLCIYVLGNNECSLGMEKSVPAFAVKSKELNELQVGYNHMVLSSSDLSVKE